MRYVLAIFFPWISFFTIGKPGRGFLCLLLQISVIGWLPAVIWALASVSAHNSDKRTDRIVEAMRGSNAAPKTESKVREIPDYALPSRRRSRPALLRPSRHTFVRNRTINLLPDPSRPPMPPLQLVNVLGPVPTTSASGERSCGSTTRSPRRPIRRAATARDGKMNWRVHTCY